MATPYYDTFRINFAFNSTCYYKSYFIVVKVRKFLFFSGFYNRLCYWMKIMLFNACSKEDIPMTSTVDVAGEWMVTVDVVDGDKVYEDPFGYGQLMWITYNTSANNGTEIWVDDLKSFWETKVKVPCNVADRTFGSATPVQNAYYDCQVTVSDGKITPGGTVTPSGMPADKFECYVTYSDDEDGYTYYVHGYRRTGFVADE